MKRAPHRAVTIRGERQFDGPLMAVRRCDGRHIKQSLSPNEGRGEMGRGEGGEWYLSKGGGGGGSPTAQIIAQGPFSGGVVITASGIYRGVSLPRPTYNSA